MVENLRTQWTDFERSFLCEALTVLDDVEGCCTLYDIIGAVKPGLLGVVFSFFTSHDMELVTSETVLKDGATVAGEEI